MRRVALLLLITGLLSSIGYAVTIGSSLVAVQDNPYDLQELVSGIDAGIQDTQYDLQVKASTIQVVEENAGKVTVTYLAKCSTDTNTTTVDINIVSDPVTTYHIFVYDTAGNQLTYTTTSSTSTTLTLSGCYDELVIYVIANNFGIAGYLDLGIVVPYVMGSNIIEVSASEPGTYKVYVSSAEALSPVSLLAGQKAYAIAIELVAKVYLVPVGVQ